MKHRGLAIILALAMSFPVAAAEKQSEQSLGRQQQNYTPSLAVVMGLIQVSHFKLWLAGNLRIWPLQTLAPCRRRSFATPSGLKVAPNSTQPFKNLRRSGRKEQACLPRLLL